MIVGFWFRYQPAASEEMTLARVPARRYPIVSAEPVEPERGEAIPDDLDPCGTEHACNLCTCRVLEPAADMAGDDLIERLSRVLTQRSAVDAWWPHVEATRRLHHGDPDPYAALVDLGQVELCPACYAAHGDPTTWSDDLLDRVYGFIGDALVFSGAEVK